MFIIGPPARPFVIDGFQIINLGMFILIFEWWFIKVETLIDDLGQDLSRATDTALVGTI